MTGVQTCALPILVKEMESGTEALKRLQQIDQNAGMVPPEVKRAAEEEFKKSQQRQPAQTPPMQAPATGALDDHSLAINMLNQAKRMEAEAKGLVAEAARMKKEAEKMYPGVMVGETAEPAPLATTPTRGRPKAKAKVGDAVQ